MKKILLTALFLSLPLLVQAQTWNPYSYNTTGAINTQNFATPQVSSNGQINYTPLEPLTPNAAFGYGGNTPLSQYLSQGYTILVTVGSLLAVVFLVVGGVRYMLSEAFTDKDKAKRQMWSAIWGLVIILGSFLILYSINPNLLTFKLDLPGLNQQASSFSPTTSGLPTGSGGGGATGNPTHDTGIPSTVTGTATAAQMQQVVQTLGLKHLMPSDAYVLYDPSALSSSQLNTVQTTFQQDCEQSGIIYTASFGTLHYTMKNAPGDIFGAPGETALVCTDN